MANRFVSFRAALAGAALLASVMLIVSPFQTWLRTSDGVGGTTYVSGWGYISGGSQISGENLNDAMSGNATFRPGTIPLIIGIFGFLAALSLGLIARGRHPHRVPAAVLSLTGVIALLWGILRMINPDSAGILDAGDSGSGFGTWLTVAAGVILTACAVLIFTGLLDPPNLRGRTSVRSRRV